MIDPVPSGTFESTWHAPRSGGRLHEGVDIFAKRGDPVYAIEAGKAFASDGANQGIGITLVAPFARYLYAHLDRREGEFKLEPGDAFPSRFVSEGELLGYVGTTGNAQGLSPHVHFEWRPADAGEDPERDPIPPQDPAPLLISIRTGTPGEITIPEVRIEGRRSRGGVVPMVLAGTALVILVKLLR